MCVCVGGGGEWERVEGSGGGMGEKCRVWKYGNGTRGERER